MSLVGRMLNYPPTAGGWDLALLCKANIERGLSMGTAGLDVERLQGLLKRQKVDSVLLEGDAAQDHAVLELSSVRRPNLVARLEYENKGFEPRLATLSILPVGDLSEDSLHSSPTIYLSGRRADDVEKIVQFVRESFLGT